MANKHTWEPFLIEAYEYIYNIRNASGKLVHETRRKTGFGGFLVAIKSTRALFKDLVEDEPASMRYLLMYKFSHDHLELFLVRLAQLGV